MNTVLITGANRGIGFGLVESYCKEGWRVLACCRDPCSAVDLQSVSRKFNNVNIFKLDVTSDDDILDISRKLENVSIDILINNAGVYPSDSTDMYLKGRDAWLQGFNVNAVSFFKVSMGLLKKVKNSSRKIIIAITSDMGSIACNFTGKDFIYRSTKAALNSIVRCLSIELRNENVSVLALHPGWVKTRMGGENAPMSVFDCANKIVELLANIGLNDTGRFIDCDGNEIVW